MTVTLQDNGDELELRARIQQFRLGDGSGFNPEEEEAIMSLIRARERTLEKDNVKMTYSSEDERVEIDITMKLNSGDIIGHRNVTLRTTELELFAQMLLQLHDKIKETAKPWTPPTTIQS